MVNYGWLHIMRLSICSLCLLIVIFSNSSNANEAIDLAFILQANPINNIKTHEEIHDKPQVSTELKFAATALIRLYQKFISSQDGPTCSFHPSCSRFGMAAIKEYGIMRGILLTADRLLRCNGSQSQHYHIDPNTEKYVDPISDYSH